MGSIDDKKISDKQNTLKIKKEVVKSVSDEFMEELDDQERDIFTSLKSVLIDKCELLEFEAVNEDNLDDFVTLITYVKNGVINIEDDGVSVKLRRPILNKDNDILTNSLTLLFERNEARERVFTKRIKISKKDVESQKEFTRASLTASFKDIEFAGTSKMISVENTRNIHGKDYMLLLTCYNFFRN